MKNACILFLVSVFAASLALPQAATTPVPPKTAAPKTATTKTATTKTVPKATPKAAPKTAAVSKTLATKKTTTATKKTFKTTRKGAAPPAQTWRNRQLAPTPTRYKEIQQALAEKGYLKQEPNGIWDAQSEEALKQFQTEKNLPPTGKINSPSLIGLGLGPKAPEPIISPPNVPAPPPPADSPASPQH